MQKHKKYLMAVIWISALSFVGAGFVGWGSFSFSSTSNAVAVVGDRHIALCFQNDRISSCIVNRNFALTLEVVCLLRDIVIGLVRFAAAAT